VLERVFVEHPFRRRPANHEHPFDVNTSIEQVFASHLRTA